KKIHAEIARHLIKSGALDLQHPDFFDCINHLNIAGEKNGLLKEVELAIVNIAAAKLAQKKSAFDKSLEYYKSADQHLSSLTEGGEIELPEFVPPYHWLQKPILFRQVFNTCK